MDHVNCRTFGERRFALWLEAMNVRSMSQVNNMDANCLARRFIIIILFCFIKIIIVVVIIENLLNGCILIRLILQMNYEFFHHKNRRHEHRHHRHLSRSQSCDGEQQRIERRRAAMPS